MDDEFELVSDFESELRKAWFVELLFWRPSALNDQEMAMFFPKRDGKWSIQTKEAIKKFGAKGLDLNQNWALVSQNWCCPACKRSKVEIFRLSNRNILLAKLEEHHDHVREYVGRRARKLLGENWVKEAHPGSAVIMSELETMASSFSPDLVCSECNAADGKAKLILKAEIPSHFSFAPSEIKKFITPAANADHQIDIVRLKETWALCKRSFQSRMSLLDQTLQLMFSGVLNREPGTRSLKYAQMQLEPEVQLYSAFIRETSHDERSRELKLLAEEFLARSVQQDSSVISPKIRPVLGKAITPSDSEYLGYCDQVSPRRWKQVAEDWCCPICNRKKRETIRKSNSGKWTGGVRELIEAVEEVNDTSVRARRRLFPGFSHEFMMSGSTIELVCSDCSEVSSRLKQRERGITDISLTKSDIRECIIHIQPNAAHCVDWDKATLRALSN